MRAFRVLPALAAAALLPLVVPAGAAMAATDAKFRCGPISITYVFDNDQSGGWWVVTTSMNCSPARYFKRYSLDIYDRPFTKQYVMDTTGYVTGAYSKTTIIPATPLSQNKSACVSAKSEVYNWDHDVMHDASRNACFKTAIP
jgi:hypothetical protein